MSVVVYVTAELGEIGEVGERYMLSERDKEWLRLNLTPRALGALGILYAH